MVPRVVIPLSLSFRNVALLLKRLPNGFLEPFDHQGIGMVNHSQHFILGYAAIHRRRAAGSVVDAPPVVHRLLILHNQRQEDLVESLVGDLQRTEIF